MAKQGSSERRRHVRARRVLSIQHKLYRRKSQLIDGGWHFALTDNMSVGGLLFISHMPYLSGDILELRVVMSGVLDVFKGFGKVTRVSPTKNKANFYVAIKYLANPNTREIKRYAPKSAVKV